MNTIAGNLLDTYPVAPGYKYLFIASLIIAVISFVSTIILHRHVKKINAANAEAVTE